MSSIEIRQQCDGINFISCTADGYFYVLKPDNSLFASVDIPKNGCRTDKIAKNYFTQDGIYTCRISDYNNETLTERLITVQRGIVINPVVPTDCLRYLRTNLTSDETLIQAAVFAGRTLGEDYTYLGKYQEGDDWIFKFGFIQEFDVIEMGAGAGLAKFIQANWTSIVGLLLAGLSVTFVWVWFWPEIQQQITAAKISDNSTKQIEACLALPTEAERQTCLEAITEITVETLGATNPTNWGNIVIMGTAIIAAGIVLSNQTRGGRL